MSARRRKLQRAPAHSRGVVLITVLFVMVVLGLLAAMLARSLGAQHARVGLEQLSRQAEYAAASGLEWGRDRALQAGLCATAQIALAGFTVTVTCTSEAVTEGAASYDVYDIAAEARRGSYGDVDFVRRSLRDRVTNR